MIASMSEADRVAHNKAGFKEKGFFWPDQSSQMLAYIDKEAHGRHTWFTPLLYDERRRSKDTVTQSNIVWADLEEVHPDSITPSAPIVIQSSPGRYQAIWTLDSTIPATLASDYSRRLAEQYKHLGADTSGADLAQLLRVPYTYNYKSSYADDEGDPPTVGIITAKAGIAVPVKLFDALPPVQGVDTNYQDMPEQLDADNVAATYNNRLSSAWIELYGTPPDPGADWSKKMWRFYQLSFEAGMTKQEVFSVAVEAKCNKFKRDGYKPFENLWWDVLRASASYDQRVSALRKFSGNALELPILYDPSELSGKESFVGRYHKWASSLGDAAPQYHELSAFIVLSALLAGNLHIEVSYGDVIPNIWGMILADTTLTRKTTAMDHATDLLESVPGCEDVVLATDGSMEGLFKALSSRPGIPSIFKRDEVQGFMASVGKKDYMAGMLDNLSKLYDGKMLKRQLSKESITVRKPVFIIQAGGIRTKMLSLLTEEHVESGFLPRFLIVTAESDIKNMKAVGPRLETAKKAESELRNELQVYRDVYVAQRPYSVGTQAAMVSPQITAHPTQACFDRFDKLQRQLQEAALTSVEPPMFTPVVERFSTSTLKCAALLAATRQEPKADKIVIEAYDLVDALFFTAPWLVHMVEVLENLGRSAFENDTQKVYKYIQENDGCVSGEVMTRFRLSAVEMRNIRETLEGRGMVDIRKVGKAVHFWVI